MTDQDLTFHCLAASYTGAGGHPDGHPPTTHAAMHYSSLDGKKPDL